MTWEHLALVDARRVEDVYFLRRRVEPLTLKQADPVLQPGQAYGSVLRNEQGWRMYYLRGGYRHDAEHATDRFEYREHLAFSNDGIHWDRPSLGKVALNGSIDNNCIMGINYHDRTGMDLTGLSGPEGFCVIDAQQTLFPHARSRYTCMYLSSPQDRWGGVSLAHSEDGIEWTGYPENPLIPGWHDTQSTLLYDPRISRYVAYLRPPVYAGPHGANRKMARVESEDLVHWSTPTVVLTTDERDSDPLELIEEGTMPRPRGPRMQYYGLTPFIEHGFYLGFAWMYDVLQGSIHVELVRSHDGVQWQREPLRQPLISHQQPAGLQAHMITTVANPPIEVGDERWIYCSATMRSHHTRANAQLLDELRIMLLSQQRDRWVGYEAGQREGELLTAPLQWNGGRLCLNARIGQEGTIKVIFCDVDGRPLTDWGLDQHHPLQGPQDSLMLPVQAGPGPKSVLKMPTHGPVRLRVQMKHATLFGFSLAEG